MQISICRGIYQSKFEKAHSHRKCPNWKKKKKKTSEKQPKNNNKALIKIQRFSMSKKSYFTGR